MAERRGFEPRVSAEPTIDFESTAFDLSAISPFYFDLKLRLTSVELCFALFDGDRAKDLPPPRAKSKPATVNVSITAASAIQDLYQLTFITSIQPVVFQPDRYAPRKTPVHYGQNDHMQQSADRSAAEGRDFR